MDEIKESVERTKAGDIEAFRTVVERFLLGPEKPQTLYTHTRVTYTMDKRPRSALTIYRLSILYPLLERNGERLVSLPHEGNHQVLVEGD